MVKMALRKNIINYIFLLFAAFCAIGAQHWKNNDGIVFQIH